MIVLLYIAVFVLGICIGSFLNCLVYRLEESRLPKRDGPRSKISSFVLGRSFCPKCKHKLVWRDLIPIFSFIVLKRRCRYCRRKISWQYLLVEVITGMLFVSLLWFFGVPVGLAGTGFLFVWSLSFLYHLVLICFLIVIFIYDLKHYIIPDEIIYPCIGIVFLIYILFPFLTSSDIYKGYLIAGLAAAFFFFLIWLMSRGKWMGFGDVKLALFMGFFLGWPNILVALFLAFIIGSLVGLVLIGFGKKKMKSQVPFGPFLITGTFLTLFFGHYFVDWYLNILLVS